MSLFICPVCGGALQRNEKAYLCSGGHAFDLASEGYVHLLPANRKHSKLPGDDKNMVRARNRFLSEGYYEPLRKALAALTLELSGAEPAILDSGCGEGWYTEGIYDALKSARKAPNIAGIDISKEAVRLASKRLRNAEFAVASAYHLPLAAESVNIVINCFSPLCSSEFLRVLKTDGYFIYVVPAPRHLWEMKCAIYDRPYENERVSAEYEGFRLIKTVNVESVITLQGRQTIGDLFAMTPYFWKTPKEGASRLEAMNALETEISFDIYAYRKSTEGV
ncbi:MAG: methyltransferase domain-containing protein [Oscillospiraceae bacterium]